MIKAIRGTRDLLPPDTDLWNRVEAKVRDVFARYNFHEIRTPIFEDTQLFSRSVGEDTDIVTKEMFTWYNGRDPIVTLRTLWRDGYEVEGPKQWLGFGHLYEGLKAHDPDIGGFDYEGIIHEVRHIILIRAQADSNAVQLIRQQQKVEEMPGVANAKFVLAVPVSEEKKARSILPSDVELQLILTPQWFRLPESLTLRPENTAGVVRAYIEHQLDKRGTLQKLYYIGPQFRRERPQKGRYRQFYQIGAE